MPLGVPSYVLTPRSEGNQRERSSARDQDGDHVRSANFRAKVTLCAESASTGRGAAASGVPPANRPWRPGGLALAAALLLALTAVTFGGVLDAGFVGFDDDRIVTENPNLRLGLTAAGVRWAFTNATFGKWTPVAWLTHLADVQFYGMDPRGHHLTNLALHLASVGLLFFVLARMTGQPRRSWIVAALFALHPLHVEPVAWVAARRDMVSTPFWLAVMYAHCAYASTRKRGWYVASLVLLTLGLMGKSMLMTLPLVLLLLDYWPLGRFCVPPGGGPGQPDRRPSWLGLVAEKIPHAAIAVVFAAVAGRNERELGAVKSLEMYPLGGRLANAAISYVRYLVKAAVPDDLAVWYPLPDAGWSAWLVALCVLVLAVVSAVAIARRRRQPWLLAGWFWYLGTLVPVIGIVQLGGFSIADRFTYMPLTGVFIALCWTLPDWSSLGRYARTAAGVAVASGLVALAALASVQVGHWRSGITLFAHTVAVTRDNYMGHYNLANHLEVAGDVPGALRHYREAVRIRPNFSKAHNNLGALLVKTGHSPEAIPHLESAVRFNPDNARAEFNLGLVYLNLRKPDLAAEHLERAAALSPGDQEIRMMRDFARRSRGQAAP